MAGVVIESTYNWYWLVDGLQDAGFRVHLANTSAIKQYEGLKHSGDETDAQHLAHLLRLGILPREHRAVRDLARKRMQLVQSCTAHVLAVENIMARQLGGRMTSNQIKRLTDDAIDSLPLAADVSLAIKANVEAPVGPMLDPDGCLARSVMRTQPSTEETGAVRTQLLNDALARRKCAFAHPTAPCAPLGRDVETILTAPARRRSC
jgi:hypothetical protein